MDPSAVPSNMTALPPLDVSSGPPPLPDGLIAYGPDVNCTLALCPIQWSVLEYEPSLAASGVFIGLFGLAAVIHMAQGFYHRTWGYMIFMLLGCIDEILGYAGRIMLHSNPFSFQGFLIQIICITTAPVFFCAAIYITLAETMFYLNRSVARFNPKFLYYFFIPCDVISLAFQAAGGATSSVSSGSNKVGVNISLFGLAFQVFTLAIFLACIADYLWRFRRLAVRRRTTPRFKVFLSFMLIAIVLILIRCAFRIDELGEGYFGSVIHNEGLFYGLESAMVTLAVFCLCVSQPGYGLHERPGDKELVAGTDQNSMTQDEAVKQPPPF